MGKILPSSRPEKPTGSVVIRNMPMPEDSNRETKDDSPKTAEGNEVNDISTGTVSKTPTEHDEKDDSENTGDKATTDSDFVNKAAASVPEHKVIIDDAYKSTEDPNKTKVKKVEEKKS